MAKGAPVHDACYRKVKAQYAVWPSARASQALAKCRKAHGNVRKSKAGSSLRRWSKERWVNKSTGRPCGNREDKGEYCRPTKRVSKATPKLNPHNARENKSRKKHGLRAKRAT